MKKTLLLPAIVLALGLFAAITPAALAGETVNVDAKGVAIEGFDPVAFFTDHKPVKGDAQFKTSREGATYYFVSAEHKAEFDKSPAKYTPQFGGFCAYGVAMGHTAKIDPAAFQIVDGRLLLQYNPEVRDMFNKDQAGNLKAADAKWDEMAGKKDK